MDKHITDDEERDFSAKVALHEYFEYGEKKPLI
jgi:hypothetical protein